MTKGQIGYLLLAAGFAVLLFGVNAYGWATFGATRQNVPSGEIENVRRGGNSNFIFWHHGMRGK